MAQRSMLQPSHPDTGALLHDERRPCLEFYQQDVTDGMRSLWKLLVLVASKSFQEVITVASKTENTVQLVIGLCFRSSAVKDVDHEALWLALFTRFACLECTRRLLR